MSDTLSNTFFIDLRMLCIFSSHWEVGSSMNCFVTQRAVAAEAEAEAEQENSHFLQ